MPIYCLLSCFIWFSKAVSPSPKTGAGTGPGPRARLDFGPRTRALENHKNEKPKNDWHIYQPGIARVSKIKFKLFVSEVFGPILVRDVFHWIRVAQTSNLTLFLDPCRNKKIKVCPSNGGPSRGSAAVRVPHQCIAKYRGGHGTRGAGKLICSGI